MPELPEVETVRRHVERSLAGRKVESLEVRHPRMLRYQPGGTLPLVEGRAVGRVGRRGKYLLVSLEDLTWVTHLGMSGRIRLSCAEDPPERHTHVVASFEGGAQLRLVDPRTFGFIQVLDPGQLQASSVASLGPDALLDAPGDLRTRAASRSVAVKTLLLDQRFLAGIGNIYADEILHRAKIRPDRRADGLAAAEADRLREAIRPVLAEGLSWGGTSLDDLAYLLPDGSAGRFLDQLRVYGREGEACRRCGGTILRSVIGGRSSYWCEGCQT